MKNTTRHKIGLNPARGSGGSAVSSPTGVRGSAPEALILFILLEGKIQHFINISAPNVLKLTSRKFGLHEREYVKWGMMTLTQYCTI